MGTYRLLSPFTLLLICTVWCTVRGDDEQHDAREGDDVTMQCRFALEPLAGESLTYYWVRSTASGHENVAIGDIPLETNYQISYAPAEGRYDLLVANVSYERDNGRFECRVKAGGSGRTLHAQGHALTVLTSPRAPVLSPGSHAQSQEGRELNLSCSSSGGSPEPTIKLMKSINTRTFQPPSPTRDVIAVENTTPSILSAEHTKLTLTASEASWVASLLCLGALWGAGPAGLISEYFGRKKTLLYLALPLVVSWILVASSPNVYGLYVGRFVGGVALGAFSVGIPPYIEDIAEKHILPTLANFYHVHFSCGVLFGYIIGLVENSSWLTVLCASVPTAFFVAFIFLPESPAYLLSQGKFQEAKAALRYFRGIDNDIDGEFRELKERLRSSAKIRVTFKELFGTRSTVKALVVSFGLMIFQQMSGIFPVLFYAKNIFETFAIGLNPPSAAIILGFCFVSSTYFSTMLLKVVRRRILLMISFAAMAVNLGCLGIFYHLKASNLSPSSTWVPLFTLCLFVSFYASGVGPIPWLMLREIFPPHMTRRATALTAGFHWFLAFAVTKFYQNLVDMVKHGWTLWAFSITCIVGIGFVYFFVPETKDRSLQEIQNEFEGIHKKRKHTHVIEVESVSEA